MRLMTAFAIGMLTAGVAHADEADGRALFAGHCSACHGVAGEGDGPVAAAMAVNVPNLRTLTMRSGGKFPADAVAAYIDGRETRAAHGSRTMPVWGPFLESGTSDEAIAAGRARLAALVEFIRELQYR